MLLVNGEKSANLRECVVLACGNDLHRSLARRQEGIVPDAGPDKVHRDRGRSEVSVQSLRIVRSVDDAHQGHLLRALHIRAAIQDEQSKRQQTKNRKAAKETPTSKPRQIHSTFLMEPEAAGIPGRGKGRSARFLRS